MSESQNPQEPIDGDPNLGADADLIAEVEDLVKPQADQDRDKVKAALIAAKRENRALAKKLKDVEPIAARAAELDDRLTRAQPIIDALVSNPKLRAEALRIAQGTRPSADSTLQPSDDEDPDAAGYAEDMGFYLADGVTPDAARARRVLNRLDSRHGRQTDERIRPLAGVVAGSHAEANIREAIQATDDAGTPLATRESIEETIKMLGGPRSPMLANPQVVDLVLNNAIGLDRRKNRTPKPVDEPLFLERQGGRRGASEPSVTPEERRMFERLGLTEKEYTGSTKKLEQGVATRRGIVLGGS